MVLAIEGPKFPQYNFHNPQTDHEKFIINGSIILLSPTDTESTALNHKEATSLIVWDCSLILAKFLEHYFIAMPHNEKNLRYTCLEVGAGLGIVGLSCSKIPNFKQIIISDISTAIPHLHASIELNGSEKNTLAMPLDWLSYEKSEVHFDNGNQPDFIVAADVIWVLDLIDPLVNCLNHFSGPHTKVIIAHQTRSSIADQRFFSSIKKRGFQVLQRITRNESELIEKDNVSIYILVNRGLA